MCNNVIDNETGEVLDEVKERVFISPFSKLKYDPIIYDDCSNPYAEVFEEVPPYAIDPNSGKFLNDSSQPKLISKGKINIQEKIQSFAKEVDLYSILEKFAYGEDASLLNARPCQYGDISDLPNDLNSYAAYVDAHFKKLQEMNPELARKVLDENISAESIEKEAESILNERISNLNNENVKKVEENK